MKNPTKLQVFLAGGGAPNAVPEADIEFLNTMEGRPLLYLAQAVAPEEYSFAECLTWLRSHSAFMGCEVIMPTTLGGISEQLVEYGGVFVLGGNPYRLLHKITEAKFQDPLREWIANGGAYYGTSAGCMILGPALQTAVLGRHGTQPGEYPLLDGLDVIKQQIYPHFVHGDLELLREFAANNNVELLALSEEAAVRWDGKQMTKYGNGSANCFSPTADGHVCVSEVM
jgi:hypothetical protein